MKTSLLAISALVAFLAMSGQASAVPVTYTLTQANPDLAGTGAGPYGTVSIDINAAATSMAVSGTGLNGYGFIGTGFLGINLSGSGFALSAGAVPATLALDAAGNEDGFGSFTFRVKDANASNPVAAFSFSATGTGLALTPNASGNTVAAHMCLIGSGACSGNTGFATNGTPSVPEPTSLMLLGVGLAGLGIWRRKAVKV